MIQPDRLRRKSKTGDAIFGQFFFAGWERDFLRLLDACLAGRQKWQFVVWRLQQRAREHTENFRRRIHRQVESFTRNGLFALFAAILPSRPTVFNLEMFFDRCLHVIVAAAVVFDRHTGTIEFPSRRDVIAAAAVVIGIFRADRTSAWRSTVCEPAGLP